MVPRQFNCTSSLLENTILAFFNLTKFGAKLLSARRITTYVAILASHPCDALGGDRFWLDEVEQDDLQIQFD